MSIIIKLKQAPVHYMYACSHKNILFVIIIITLSFSRIPCPLSLVSQHEQAVSMALMCAAQDRATLTRVPMVALVMLLVLAHRHLSACVRQDTSEIDVKRM